jgi:hypothetical protein
MGFKTGTFYIDPEVPVISDEEDPMKKFSPRGYNGSMAQAIEEAFKNEWKNFMGSDPPPFDLQMKLLCVAIGQGVINHLASNPDGLRVSFTIAGITLQANVAVNVDDAPYF